VGLGDVGLGDLAGVVRLGLGAQEGVLERRDLGVCLGELVGGAPVDAWSGAASSVRAAGSISGFILV